MKIHWTLLGLLMITGCAHIHRAKPLASAEDKIYLKKNEAVYVNIPSFSDSLRPLIERIHKTDSSFAEEVHKELWYQLRKKKMSYQLDSSQAQAKISLTIQEYFPDAEKGSVLYEGYAVLEKSGLKRRFLISKKSNGERGNSEYLVVDQMRFLCEDLIKDITTSTAEKVVNISEDLIIR